MSFIVRYPKNSSHWEMGLLFGRENLELSEKLGIEPFKEASDDALYLASRIEKVLLKFYPEILEEIRGIAHSSGYPYEVVLSNIVFCGSMQHYRCLAFLFRGSESYLALNYELDEKYKVFRFAHVRHPVEANASIGNGDCYIGLSDGINEKGLAITGTSISRSIVGIGISPQLLIRMILEKCSSAEEALRLMKEMTHLLRWNYLLCDGRRAFRVEIRGARDVAIREIKDDSYVVGNHTGEIEEAPERVRRVYEYLRGLKSFNIDVIKDILRNHEYNVCNHSSFPTIWSSIYCPDSCRAWVAPGRPCENEYVDISWQ